MYEVFSGQRKPKFLNDTIKLYYLKGKIIYFLNGGSETRRYQALDYKYLHEKNGAKVKIIGNTMVEVIYK